MSSHAEDMLGTVIGLAVAGCLAFVGVSLVLAPIVVPLWLLALH